MYGVKYSEKVALEISNKVQEYFGEKVNDFAINGVMENPHIEFSMNFVAYNYFIVYLNYDRGHFGCGILSGELGIDLPNSQEWYDKADMTLFCKELEMEIELRIPERICNNVKEWRCCIDTWPLELIQPIQS